MHTGRERRTHMLLRTIHNQQRWQRWQIHITPGHLLPVLVIVGVGLIYLPAISAHFVWDDTLFLADVPLYRDPALWIAALHRPFVLSPNYFRPFALLTFM